MQRCGANFILILFIYIYTNTLKVYTTTFFWAGLVFHYISRLMMEERRKIKTRQRCYCQAEGLFSQRQVLSYYTRIFKKVYKYNTARKRGSTFLSGFIILSGRTIWNLCDDRKVTAHRWIVYMGPSL
jgi:hypothetical protein